MVERYGLAPAVDHQVGVGDVLGVQLRLVVHEQHDLVVDHLDRTRGGGR
jgi:hypothetical protein